MARITSADRARRLLALVSRFREADGARIPIEQLAQSVGATPKKLEDDLLMLSVCGVAPYDPLDCVPIIVDEGYVQVWGEMPALRGSIRLSNSEARALATAMQTAGFAADDDLVARLLSAAGASESPEAIAAALRSAVSAHDMDVYEALASAAAQLEVVTIAYQRGGEEDVSERDIEPHRLLAERGVWYVSAYCRLAEAPRTFRVDRIRSAVRTGETFEPRSEVAEGHAFDGTGLPVATLAFADPGSYEDREWPDSRVVAERDGRLLVEVPFGGTSWIARQVLARFGDVEALEPAEVRNAVALMAKTELARLEA